MRLEYRANLLEHLLDVHKTTPLKFVYVGGKDFEAIAGTAKILNILLKRDTYWLSIGVPASTDTITVYFEEQEETFNDY